MWAEIATAGSIIGLTGITMRFLNAKIDKKVDQAVFDERTKNIKDDLTKGDEKFTKIMDTQIEMIETLGRYDERLKTIQEAVAK